MTKTVDLEEILNRTGLHVPNIWLPGPGIDMTDWAVVACDVFTAEYWNRVKQRVGQNPSTLHLIEPEVLIDQNNLEEVMERIRNTGIKYIRDGILQSRGEGFVLVDRKTPYADSRKSLVVAFDLEKYGSSGLIRPTEGIIRGRLKTREGIGRTSVAGVSHAIVLINDIGRTVVEPLFRNIEQRVMLYDFDLMENGGHVRGYKIGGQNGIREAATSLHKLAEMQSFLYAIGDGNHTFAAAKAVWDELKANARDLRIMDHPLRYVSAEIMNVYDEGLHFYPIHRVVSNTNPIELLEQMKLVYEGQGFKFEKKVYETEKQMQEGIKQSKSENRYIIGFKAQNNYGILIIEDSYPDLAHSDWGLRLLQSFLDGYISNNGQTKLDFPHEESVVTSEGLKPNNIGFFIPEMPKDKFFDAIQTSVLPRKAFSIGKSEEKPYYIQASLNMIL